MPEGAAEMSVTATADNDLVQLTDFVMHCRQGLVPRKGIMASTPQHQRDQCEIIDDGVRAPKGEPPSPNLQM